MFSSIWKADLRVREFFQLLVHSPNAPNSWDKDKGRGRGMARATWEVKARNSFWISHFGGRDPSISAITSCLPGVHLQGAGSEVQSSSYKNQAIWYMECRYPCGSLTSCATGLTLLLVFRVAVLSARLAS